MTKGEQPLHFSDLASHKPVRVGILGCGYWGSKHIRIMSSTVGVSEVSVIDSDPKVCRRLRETFRNLRTFRSLEVAIPHIDALVIATPPSTHASLGLAAIQAGKHVLIEKPLATSVAEARSLVTQAGRYGVVLMVGHTFQYNPAVRELRRRIKLGDLGEILYIRSERLNLGLYQPDVDVVWDLAPHDISILNYLLNDAPATATAWGDALALGGKNDLAHVRFEYPGRRIVGYAQVSWLDPRKTRTVTVVGSQKMAVYDDLAEERLRLYDRGVGAAAAESPSPERPMTYRYGDIVAPHIRADEPLAVQDQHFISCIINSTPPETDGVSGLRVVTALEAIQKSIRERVCVPIRYSEDVALSEPSACSGLEARHLPALAEGAV